MPRLGGGGAGLHDELLPAPPACRRAMKASANTDPAHGGDGAGAAAAGLGGVTAANASQLSDGAAAVLLADMDAALADGCVRWRASRRGWRSAWTRCCS